MRKYQIEQFVSHSKSRRRGQALLLSVLIMIFIVLLGTTFIAIVASNMSNTARTGSKDEARQAAKAGIEFADSQLTGSDQGLDWRPDVLNPPPASTDPAYNYYYSSLDRAQGWSQPFYYNFNPPIPAPAYNAEFVKYPNVQDTSQAGSSANFMIRVSQVQANEPDNAGNTKTGDIRIESIGFADNDPAAYYRIVAYKTGPSNNPLTAAMRSVSNWDWTDNTVPQGTVANGSTGATFTLSNVEGTFQNGDYVTVWDSVANQVGNGIASVSSGTVTVTASFTPSVGSLVQKAAALGAPTSLNFDNATATNVDYRVSGINYIDGTPVNTPGSVWINGGLVWFGNNFATNLRSPLLDTNVQNGTQAASTVKVSGVITAKTIDSVDPTKAADGSVNVSWINGTAPTTPTPMLASSTAGNQFITSLTPQQSDSLVSDGLNRLRGSLSPTRQVQNFTPPDITAGGDGFGRYRQLTEYSTSTDPNNPQASAYGYGEGIYINNPTDVEKVGSTPMTQTQLHDLWFGTGTTNYMRLGTPEAPTSTTNSLEEQHLRGWVSADQFLPRGAEVVLNDVNPPTITVTLDARADNDSDTTNGFENLYSTGSGSNVAHLDQNKMLRDKSGNILQGVYTHTFDWPTDGTLFAEGNIRIRGKISAANSPSNSLTVVSMNNIYIEGSIGAGSKKVLLLAKKNVTVNPTQVLDGTEVISTLASVPTGDNHINVSDGSNFQAGDYIIINDTLPRNVVSVSGDQLTLDGDVGNTYSVGQIVHTVFDPTLGGTALPSNVATRLATFTQAMTRRLRVSTTDPANIRLAFRHSAEYKKALMVQIDTSLNGDKASGTRLDSAELNNKAATAYTDPVITANRKYLQINYANTPLGTDGLPSGPQVSGSDMFPDNFAATPYQTNTGDATDTKAADNISLGDMYKQMLDKYTDPHWDYGDAKVPLPPPPPPLPGTPLALGTNVQSNRYYTFPSSSTSGNQWADIDNISDAATYHSDNAKHPLFYSMASVGNRKDFSTTSDPYAPTAEPASYPINQQVYPAATTPFIVPMATSMWLKINGIQATLQGDQWDSTLGSFFKVLQFGFSPLFVNKDNAGNPIVTDIYQADGTTSAYPAQAYADMEDTLTSDQYFYQPYGQENVTPTYGGNTYAKQTQFDKDSKYTLDSRLISDPAVTRGATNVLVLQLNDAEVGGHPLDYYYQNAYQIPFYRISNLKLQNETLDNSSHELTAVGTGATFDINAYVYAQEGGWYVIPGTDFDSAVKNGDDLNRDGVISQGESVAAYRYHHYNYQIVFTGAIMENQTATVSDVAANSDVGLWMDKWATVKMTVPTATPTYDSENPATSNFNDILYYYDPTAAAGTLSTDPGFHAPAAPGLIYQG